MNSTEESILKGITNKKKNNFVRDYIKINKKWAYLVLHHLRNDRFVFSFIANILCSTRWWCCLRSLFIYLDIAFCAACSTLIFHTFYCALAAAECTIFFCLFTWPFEAGDPHTNRRGPTHKYLYVGASVCTLCTHLNIHVRMYVQILGSHINYGILLFIIIK